MNQAQIEKLMELGNRWQKNGMDRIYINDLPTLYGLRVERYNTGNICAAWLNGESISNNSARQLVYSFSNAKIWYDMADGKFRGQGLDGDDFREIVAAIRKMIETN